MDGVFVTSIYFIFHSSKAFWSLGLFNLLSYKPSYNWVRGCLQGTAWVINSKSLHWQIASYLMILAIIIRTGCFFTDCKNSGIFSVGFFGFIFNCTIKKICSHFLPISLHISEVNRCYYSLLDCTSNWPARFLKGINYGSFKLLCKGTFCLYPRAKLSDFQDNSKMKWQGCLCVTYSTPQTPGQPVWSQRATPSSPRVICSYDSNFFGGYSSSRGNHWTASVLQPWQRTLPRGCRERWRKPAISGSVPRADSCKGNPELAADAASKQGLAWQRICPASFKSVSELTRWDFGGAAVFEAWCCSEQSCHGTTSLNSSQAIRNNPAVLKGKMDRVMYKVTLLARNQGQQSHLLTYSKQKKSQVPSSVQELAEK